ncbi:phage major tail tube protein [Paenibacillus harenae]|uniref:P2 family phage contractile tail tube protein n=1 Tax=Paenibacillus harenae TaxID=306543 RepID=A0ABT9U539_PAEHA|nr:phage major tail tube protein [Paenibacillus harenae]MDQ0114357.1 P2 family phage contractile tail tube protein [Paenibacillus harenae]
MKIPEKVTQYSVYRNGSEFLGTADIELPSFESLTETIKGAGIAGEIDSPTIGHFGASSVTINWRTIDPAAISLLEPKQHALDFRVASQALESATGQYSIVPTKISVRGMPKTLALGSLEANATTGTSNELEVSYIKIVADGKTILELDKYNSIFIVNGVDYLAAERAALGK